MICNCRSLYTNPDEKHLFVFYFYLAYDSFFRTAIAYVPPRETSLSGEEIETSAVHRLLQSGIRNRCTTIISQKTRKVKVL